MKFALFLVCVGMTCTVGRGQVPSVRLPTPDVRPVVLTAVDPDYSKEGRAKKISGIVKVWLEVGLDGEVEQARVIRGLGYGLDEKAVAAVKQYRFKPAMKDGQPIESELYIDVKFEIF